MRRARSGQSAAGDREFTGTLVFGMGLVGAAGLNFVFSSLMGRMLAPPVFGTLGVLIAGLLALIGPVNALSGGTEMFAALHDRFPRGRKRLVLPGAAALVWVATMFTHSTTVRSTGWFALGAAFLVLLAWNRGALVGLGRFQFVGLTFVVEGAARLALPVALVLFGFGLEGASAGLVLGMLVALIFTEVAIPRISTGTSEPLGRDVWIALLGLFALGLTQIVDVFAIRLANPNASGAYVGAASLARVALFSQMPAAAYALRRSAVEGPRRALKRTAMLAIVPGTVAVGLIELAPRFLLRLTYGSRFVGATGTLRVLGLAMLLGGFATILAQLLMGRGATGWVWSIIPVTCIGTVAIITLAHAPTSVAVYSLFLQGGAFMAIGLPALALLREESESGGVLILNWRDTRHPQGGGSEVYVEQIATRLVAAGRPVTVFCAAHDNAPAIETRGGVRFVHRGSWRTVYWWAFVYHLLGRLEPHDFVIDVKNGIPFFAPAYCRKPVICLVHHVHEAQWSMNFPRWMARGGWWVESRLAPRVYRYTHHVAVSESTRLGLIGLGVPAMAIDVVPNGAQPLEEVAGKAPAPTIACLGRLVPHKRIEIVLDAVTGLRDRHPDLRLLVIGSGPWDERLVAHARARGIEDRVTFTGWVEEDTKRRLLSEAWVLAVPSVMEGWGQNVIEAAACKTPALAFRVGGLEESIRDGLTGILVDRVEEFEPALARLLSDPALREQMGTEAARHATSFSWDRTAYLFDSVLVGLSTEDASVRVLESVAVVVESSP
jgi:glycosyltransferase involved in cell wall biosynthesis